MPRYHIGKNGPGVCKATKRACPVGGDHFETAAAASHAYEYMQGGSFGTHAKNFKVGDDVYSPEQYVIHLAEIHQRWDQAAVQALHSEILVELGEDGNTFSDSLQITPHEVQIDESVYVDADPYGEFEEDVADHDKGRFRDNANWRSTTLEQGGYYNDDCYLQYHFAVPDSLKEQVSTYCEARDTTEEYARSQNPAYPAWACFPANEFQRLKDMQKAPVLQLKGVKRYDEIIDHEAIVAKTHRLQAKHEQDRARAQVILNALMDAAANPTGAEVELTDGSTLRLNKTNRRKAIGATQAVIQRANYNVMLNTERRARFTNLTPREVQEARVKRAELEAINEARRREYVIEHLAQLAPEANVERSRGRAEAWVRENPSCVNELTP